MPAPQAEEYGWNQDIDCVNCRARYGDEVCKQEGKIDETTGDYCYPYRIHDGDWIRTCLL